jgi:hypothetical protein
MNFEQKSQRIYVKQFIVPEVHRDTPESQIMKWLKMGINQPS